MRAPGRCCEGMTDSRITHWSPADPASSRRVYPLGRGAAVDVLEKHDLPEKLAGDEAIEGRCSTWAVLGRGDVDGAQALLLCRDGQEAR